MSEIIIDKPKETYDEIKEIIGLLYRNVPSFDIGSGFKGFGTKFPNIYRIYLRIAANRLNK